MHVKNLIEPLKKFIASVVVLVCVVSLLSKNPKPIESQPFPDSAEYVDVALQISNGHGFKTSIDEQKPATEQTNKVLRPSRYPPGFPLVLSLFTNVSRSQTEGIQIGSKMVGIFLLVAMFIASWLMSGPMAALLVALLGIYSPFVGGAGKLVMSDALGAAIVVIILIFFLLGDRYPKFLHSTGVAIGFLSGYAVLVRLSAVVVLLAALICSLKRRTFIVTALAALPGLMFLAVYQWTEFGNPFFTGYDYYLPNLKEFAMQYVNKPDLFGEKGYIFADRLNGSLMRWTCPCPVAGPTGHSPNWFFYPSLLGGFFWIYAPPGLGVLGLYAMFRGKSLSHGLFAIVVSVGTVTLFTGYFYQGARLVAPAGVLVMIFSANGTVSVARRLVQPCKNFLMPQRG
jgi:hypothetical protein